MDKMRFDRRDFLRNLSLTAATGVALPLSAREGIGPMVHEDAAPYDPSAKNVPGALAEVVHEADLCVIGGGEANLEYERRARCVYEEEGRQTLTEGVWRRRKSGDRFFRVRVHK